MLDVENHSFLKYVLFACLYFSEGIQLAIIWVLVPIYFLQKQFPPGVATLVTGAIMIPWTLKFFFGFTVDHYARLGRKRFILLGGIISSAGLILAAVIDPALFLLPFAVFLFVGQCGNGFLDVSADAWAIQLTTKKERGKLNGAMTAGLFAGMAMGSSLLAYIANQINYTTSFFVAAVLILLILLFPLLIKEKLGQKRKSRITPIVLREFKKKTTMTIALFLPIVSINSGIITLAAPLFMDLILQLNIAQIGFITTVFTLGRVAGSFLCGAASDKWGRKTILIIIILFSILFAAFLIFAHSWQSLTFFYGIIGFLNGGLFAAVLALCMDITNPSIGASQFSLLISLINAGELFGGAISGTLISLLGFSRVFLYAAWILGPALLILYYIHMPSEIRWAKRQKN
jgi:PAT family beta-lactamase induction signal transducer AmpG